MFHISKKDEYNIMINCEINLKEASKIRSVINTEEDGGEGLDLNDGGTGAQKRKKKYDDSHTDDL